MIVVAAVLSWSMALVAPDVARAQAELPDVVLLRSGSEVRGTISEALPEAHVVIVTEDGDTRVVAWTDVDYAGPASEAPMRAEPPNVAPSAAAPSTPARTAPPARGPTVAAGDRVTLDFTSEPPRLRVYAHRPGLAAWVMPDADAATVRASRRGFMPLCTTPCRITLRPGTMALAIGVDDDVVTGETLVVRQPARFHLRHVSRSTERSLAFAGALVASIGTGLLLLANAFDGPRGSDESAAAVLGLGLVGSIALFVYAMLSVDDLQVIRAR